MGRKTGKDSDEFKRQNRSTVSDKETEKCLNRRQRHEEVYTGKKTRRSIYRKEEDKKKCIQGRRRLEEVYTGKKKTRISIYREEED